MKKIWKIIIIVVVVLGICTATCPGYQRHCDAIVKVINNALHEQAEKLTKDLAMDQEAKNIFATMEQSVIKQVEPTIKQVLKVKNRIIFSVGRMENKEDGATTVSIGILGKVFTNKKELKTEMTQ